MDRWMTKLSSVVTTRARVYNSYRRKDAKYFLICFFYNINAQFSIYLHFILYYYCGSFLRSAAHVDSMALVAVFRYCLMLF
jgi:hypothetical protein